MALLATALIPVSYVVLFFGLIKIGTSSTYLGVAICLLGITLGAVGEVVGEQQKQQLTKLQLIRKIYTNSIVAIRVMFTVMVFIHVFK